MTNREIDTVLAALRLWQSVLDGTVRTDASEKRCELLRGIATCTTGKALSPEEIDDLCVSIVDYDD